MNIISSWSGGKDSCYALMLAISKGNRPSVLLNMMNENNKISRSHGLTPSLLNQQAKAIGVPLVGIPSSWEDYDKSLISQGGGIFSRFDKSIKLSAEINKWLKLTVDELSPQALIKTL